LYCARNYIAPPRLAKIDVNRQKSECCRYTTKAPTGSVRGLGSEEIKNDDTEVPSFLTARISDFNQRASSHIRVPNCIQQDVGTGKQKWRHRSAAISIARFTWFPRSHLVTKKSTEKL
jgi:hypothetical protein